MLRIILICPFLFFFPLNGQGDLVRITPDSTSASFNGVLSDFAYFNDNAVFVYSSVPYQSGGQSGTLAYLFEYDLNTLQKKSETNVSSLIAGEPLLSNVYARSLGQQGFYLQLIPSASSNPPTIVAFDSLGLEKWRKVGYTHFDLPRTQISLNRFTDNDVLSQSNDDLVLISGADGSEIYRYNLDSLVLSIKNDYFPAVDSLVLWSRYGSTAQNNDHFLLLKYTAGIEDVLFVSFDRNFTLIDSLSNDRNKSLSLNSKQELSLMSESYSYDYNSFQYNKTYTYTSLENGQVETYQTSGNLFNKDIGNPYPAVEFLSLNGSKGYFTLSWENLLLNSGNDTMTFHRLKYFNSNGQKTVDHPILWFGIPSLYFNCRINAGVPFFINSKGETFVFVAVQRYFSLNSVDSYLLKIDANGNSPLSDSESENREELIISPNPAHNNLSILNSSKSEYYTVEIFNIDGQKQLVKTGRFGSEFSISDLAPGKYIIQVTGFDGSRFPPSILIKN